MCSGMKRSRMVGCVGAMITMLQAKPVSCQLLHCALPDPHPVGRETSLPTPHTLGAYGARPRRQLVLIANIFFPLFQALRYCVKTRERREMQSSPLGSVFSFLMPRMADGDDHVQVKFEPKRSTPCENSGAVHISPHNSRTVIGSEKSSIIGNTNKKSTTGFPMSHYPRSCVTHNFPKCGLDNNN